MSALMRGGLLILAAALVAGCANVKSTIMGQAGKVAPEIAGVDADGVAFNLSDYRGKVVLLDFWSTN
jgi:hypothetical protein